ncbi:hypothetical protein [Oleiharenicola sp. Vm1]|uniref:hypothetical protein n=1 Tax=Oleiharenicola sp. Vm1 TaxID=3398393 RepID=UPI0039F52D41
MNAKIRNVSAEVSWLKAPLDSVIDWPATRLVVVLSVSWTMLLPTTLSGLVALAARLEV